MLKMSRDYDAYIANVAAVAAAALITHHILQLVQLCASKQNTRRNK